MSELVRLLQGGDEGVALVAHQALIELINDDSRQVSAAAAAALGADPASEPHGDPADLAGETKIQVTAPAVARPINLSFEGLAQWGRPLGWFNSAGFVDRVSTAYGFAVVPRTDVPNKHCVRMENPAAGPEEFGSLMQRCLAKPYLSGRTVRLEAEARTENVEQWAGIWLRADGPDDVQLFFDNMSNRSIRGSSPWTRYTIEALLPPETVWLNYGIVLVGRGIMWADDFRLWVWDADAGRWKLI